MVMPPPWLPPVTMILSGVDLRQSQGDVEEPDGVGVHAPEVVVVGVAEIPRS